MSAIAKHLDILKEKVFQTEKKWPQFDLLLDDIQSLANEIEPGKAVVCFERTLLYGGFSLIAPFFVSSKLKFHSIDCSPPSADERGAYNKKMVDDSRFIKIKHTSRATISNTKLEAECADLVLIPNLVHHVEDQDLLFKELNRITKKNGMIYIFEPLVRELHQEPDDFLRYTPYGLETLLKKHGFETINRSTTGGPFEVISYCWLQALEYLPTEERKGYEKWFYDKHFNELLRLNQHFTKNLERNHTSFPTAYSVKAKKFNVLWQKNNRDHPSEIWL